MLRWLLAVLLLANAGYFAWSQGHLKALGLSPAESSEPERVTAQIRPTDLRLLNGPLPEAPASTEPLVTPPVAEPEAVPAEPTACWHAGGMTPEQAASLRKSLEQLDWPAGSWQLTENRSAGRWVVYMGRYNAEQMTRKKDELKELKIAFREVSLPTLGPGLVLGTYSSEAAVQQALQDVSRKGVRTARAAQERPEASSFSLQLPAISEVQRATVDARLSGKALQRCG